MRHFVPRIGKSLYAHLSQSVGGLGQLVGQFITLLCLHESILQFLPKRVACPSSNSHRRMFDAEWMLLDSIHPLGAEGSLWIIGIQSIMIKRLRN